MIAMATVHLASWASRVRTLLVQLRGPGGQPEDAAEVWQPPGLRTRPVVRATTEAMVLELPNGGRLAFVVDKARDEGAVEPEAGETQLHGLSAQSAVVRIRASGAVEITAASGQVVTLQGGAQPFVRGTAYADALDAFLDALDTFTDGIAHAAPAAPNAALTVAAVLALQTPLATAIAALKSARATYLSTRIAGD